MTMPCWIFNGSKNASQCWCLGFTSSGTLEGLHSLSDVKQYARFWIGMFSKAGFVPAKEVDDICDLHLPAMWV